jgi:hypothetical protein
MTTRLQSVLSIGNTMKNTIWHLTLGLYDAALAGASSKTFSQQCHNATYPPSYSSYRHDPACHPLHRFANLLTQ